MPLEGMRQAWAVLAVAGLLFFWDAPLLTVRQRFVAQRRRERWILLSFDLALVALWALARFALELERPIVSAALEPGLAAAGLALAAAGVTLAVWAKLRLGRWFSAAFAVKEGHPLVTDGPYSVTRHPIYTGALATVAGGALVWNGALALALAGLLSGTLFLHTVYEEVLFEGRFGDAYRAYQRRVPRLVPLLRRGRAQ